MLEVASAALTVATIALAIEVLRHWKAAAVTSVKQTEPLSPDQWFILGVFIGFIGQSLDNTYWLMAWSSHYVDPESATTLWLFENGFLFNIPFRQIAGILAAVCHVRAAVKTSNLYFKSVLWLSAVLGVSYASLLWLSAN